MSTDIKEKVNIALLLHQTGQLAEAEKLYTEILKVDPNNVSTLNLYGLLKFQNKQFEEAVFYIKKAIELNPCAYFYENLGRVYSESNNFNEAISIYKKALALEPDNFDVWFNLALAYKNNTQFNEAIEAYQSALSLKPNHSGAYFNLANIYENKNDTFSALEYYKKSSEYKINDDNDINYFLSVSYLKTKNFKEGWKYYEYRPSKEFSILTQTLQYKDLMKSKPLWTGEPIENKTLFVYYEAGLGDSIMYARYIPLLKDKCAKVLFRPQSNLVELFKDAGLNAEIIHSKTPVEKIVFDTHIPLMSLTYVLQLNTEEIPFADGYLKANSEKVKLYKENYFNSNKFKIGIKWQGNPAYDRNRIIPLEAFCKLFDLPNIKFYSIQKGDGEEELKNLPDNYEITDLGKTFNDFADTAAAIENLDLVICNDTSVAHLVGALGKPCWIMLPFVSNWRWHTDINYSPWYKSIKLFKQTVPDNWNDVVDEVCEKLKNILYKT